MVKNMHLKLEEYTPLVVSIAKEIGEDIDSRTLNNVFDDMIQEGYIGLLKARDNFSCRKQVKFYSYARKMIYWRVKDFVRKWVLGIRRCGKITKQYLIDDEMQDLEYFEGFEKYVVDDEIDAKQQAFNLLDDLLSRAILTKKEHFVLIQTFGIGRTLLDVATELGITEAYACQLRARAKNLIRKTKRINNYV